MTAGKKLWRNRKERKEWGDCNQKIRAWISSSACGGD